MSNKRNANPIWIVVGAVVAVIIVICLWRAYWVNTHPPMPETPQAPITEVIPPVTDVNPPDNDEQERIEEPAEQPETSPDSYLAPDGNSIEDMEIGDMGALGLKAFSVPAKNKPTKGSISSMITLGKSLQGTKYQYGAPRRDNYKATFDCSSFTRYLFSVGRGMNIGSDSRVQAQYVKAHGIHRYADWKKAVSGDLMFFTSYKGTKSADYKGRDMTVTHVGVIIGKDTKGNLLLLHTASNPTGVRIQTINGTHLQYRFQSMGRPY